MHPTKTQITRRISAICSVFVFHMNKLCVLGYPKCTQRIFWSDCANLQDDLIFDGRTCPKVRFLTLRLIFVVYSTRRFVLCLTLCHFVLVFFSPFSIAITSLGEQRANLSAFRTFVRFVLVWIWQFPLPLSVWEGLRFVIVALPGLFSYPFLHIYRLS